MSNYWDAIKAAEKIVWDSKNVDPALKDAAENLLNKFYIWRKQGTFDLGQAGGDAEVNDETMNNAFKTFVKELNKSAEGWELTPPSDENDIFRLKDGPGQSDNDWEWLPPQGPDDIFRLKPVPKGAEDKGQPKPDDKKSDEAKDENKEDDDDDEDRDEPTTVTVTPTPDGDDDRTGVVHRLPGGPDLKDPFDVPDASSRRGLRGGDDLIDPSDKGDGVGPRKKFTGGLEPTPPEEKIGPKFRPMTVISWILGKLKW